MAIDWFDLLLGGPLVGSPMGYDGDWDNSYEADEFWRDAARVQIRERQVWRINNLLKANLNEKKGKPGEIGRNQAQIRTVGEGLHDETFRRLKGRLEGIDALLDLAEKSRENRERW